MKKSKEQHHQKKTNKITSSVWTTTKQKILFQKKPQKPSKQSVEKNTVFSDSRCRQLNYYSIDDALLFVCAL